MQNFDELLIWNFVLISKCVEKSNFTTLHCAVERLDSQDRDQILQVVTAIVITNFNMMKYWEIIATGILLLTWY